MGKKDESYQIRIPDLSLRDGRCEVMDGWRAAKVVQEQFLERISEANIMKLKILLCN